MISSIKNNLLALCISSCLSSGLGMTTAVAGPTATPKEAAVSGVWKIAAPIKALKDAKGAAPPLNAAGKQLYAQRQAQLAKGDTAYDLSLKCKPIGFPRSIWDGGGPFDIQVEPELVFQGYSFNRNHRNFKFGPGLPKLQIPRYYGTSAARWDGNTLVVESGMYNENSMLDSTGLPLSDGMTLVERYKPLNNGKQLEVRLTITDARYYSKPWDVAVTFNRVPDGRIAEDVCQERSEFYKPLMKGRL